ncbi:hypothetical protein V6N12_051293 [Hibiscus sabdariffa]|uniref:Association with the SNF1 complex (ASC) domain-containing protein n=1 Tax=Hibiscus sabdariffa TaxID=183260 RepID=A0ABR2GFE6_9ROSI
MLDSCTRLWHSTAAFAVLDLLYILGVERSTGVGPVKPFVSLLSMNNQYGKDQDEATVIGFEVPRSPDSSYNNVYPGSEDDARDPPVVPPHLHRSLLSYPSSLNASKSIPLPENVILNHLYIENREAPRSVVALGFTHRFRSKYVTVVLYKPVPRRGSTST